MSETKEHTASDLEEQVANEIIKIAKTIGAAKPRRSPDSKPPRDDVRKRYKKDDIAKDDRADYMDTLYDKDLRND